MRISVTAAMILSLLALACGGSGGSGDGIGGSDVVSAEDAAQDMDGPGADTVPDATLADTIPDLPPEDVSFDTDGPLGVDTIPDTGDAFGADTATDAAADTDEDEKDACEPACDGKECGTDGCGGFCGECPEHAECIEGQCICYFPPCGDECCGPIQTCFEGACCDPACEGKDCGDDGCGGGCGECTAFPGSFCDEGGQCGCAPDCQVDDCVTPDGCGGTCGSGCLEVVLDPVAGPIPTGDPVTITGMVTEDGGPATELVLAWESDLDGPLGAGDGPDASGAVSLTTDTLSAGLHTISLTATNPAQNQGTGQVEVEVCESGVNQGFDEAPEGSAWKVYGDAWWNAGGWMDLTDLEQHNAGSVFNVAAPLPPGDMAVAFSFQTGPQAISGADGLSLNVWNVADEAALDAVVALGAACPGSALGFGVAAPCGDWVGSAFHVEIDTRWTPNYPDPTGADHVAVMLDGDVTDHKLWAELGEIEDMAWHDVIVTVTGSHVTVKVDGATLIDGDLPGWSFQGGYLGITGKTGNSYNYHRVDDIQMAGDCVGPVDPPPSTEWLLSVDNAIDTLQRVDVATGETTDLCVLPHSDSYPSLTFSRENLLFGSRDGTSLDLIDPCTCEVTPLGDYGDFSGVYGITSDVGVALMGIAADQDLLLGIDKDTGAATSIGALGVDFTLTGATWSDALEGLYAINGGTDKLYLVDPLTGVATEQADLSYDFNNVGIELHPADGVIYACSTDAVLLTVDPVTGQVTVIGAMGQEGACTNLAAPWAPVDCIEP